MKVRILAFILFFVLIPFSAYTDTRDQRFLDGKKAAQQGDWNSVMLIYQELDGYPLQNYLMYFYLKENLGTVDSEKILNYASQFSDSPTGVDLRRKWYGYLAENNNWEKLVDVYVPAYSTETQCEYLTALVQTGKSEQAFPEVAQLWLTGNSQPDSCTPVFKTWLN